MDSSTPDDGGQVAFGAGPVTPDDTGRVASDAAGEVPPEAAGEVASEAAKFEFDAGQVVFDDRGLVACVIQDWRTGEVLTLAYMNAEALERTQKTGEIHLWSRSRQEPWHKGETSGNTQLLRSLRLDCDGDAVLALVEPRGPACHTGERSCFHRGQLEPLVPFEALPALERVIAARDAERPAGSYTARLLENPPLMGEKVREEAAEAARAAERESDERLDEEAADVLFHLAVLLRSRGRALADAAEVLSGRRR
ncbi:MAG TPA: bifunctional phosphoribosyl-AMP cyclohydrolase/phosphoribosyl-ATP diphosphatase HisIE [Solirubrobacteraceae bacterium]|nr:bifunctional phosphoribosyl-AMP cyclohydrolase/phosphoribosyl-ATP diphosphatase HisIE [Solirubrobacteraceae bacterium]